MIIPAYNEERRIGTVLRAVCESRLATEIIVVSDASHDRTAAEAREFPQVKVIELLFNSGKGGAMAAGVAATQADVIAFVDADLTGLQGIHVDRIIEPVLANTCDMCVGIFRGGKFLSDTAQRISPYISGQRAMKRWIFDQIPFIGEMRMGVEVTINTYAKRNKARVIRVVLHGVSNTFKESKMGLMKGVKARTKMYAEIGRALVRMRRKKVAKARRIPRKPGKKKL